MLIQRMDKKFEEYEKKPETRATVNKLSGTRRSSFTDAFNTTGQILSAFMKAVV